MSIKYFAEEKQEATESSRSRGLRISRRLLRKSNNQRRNLLEWKGIGSADETGTGQKHNTDIV